MSDDADFAGFAPPPFQPAAALLQLQRALRDLKLSARGDAFELQGRPVLQLKTAAETIEARIARRPVLTPEWDTRQIKSAADQRKLLDDVKQRLARWQRED
jgi:hypothetical protein